MTDRPTIAQALAALADDVGPLTGADAIAEQLVALAHDNRDRDVWGGDRAITYWDRLPDRLRTACYGGPTLGHWWERVSRSLGCEPPRRIEDRRLLATALASGQDHAVLDALRTRTEALCLRVRLSVQITRDNQAEKAATTQESLL